MFGDGGWHLEGEIAKRIGASRDATRAALYKLRTGRVGGARTDRRRVGAGYEHRLFPKQEYAIGPLELIEKLAPIIKRLEAEGRKNDATISIGKVAALAELLRRQLDDWTKHPAPRLDRVQMDGTDGSVQDENHDVV